MTVVIRCLIVDSEVSMKPPRTSSGCWWRTAAEGWTAIVDARVEDSHEDIRSVSQDLRCGDDRLARSYAGSVDSSVAVCGDPLNSGSVGDAQEVGYRPEAHDTGRQVDESIDHS